MPRNTYLYENGIFINKVRQSIILGSKGKSLSGREKSVSANLKFNLHICRKMYLGRYERSIKVDWIFSADKYKGSLRTSSIEKEQVMK